jgi:hypothetical protein
MENNYPHIPLDVGSSKARKKKKGFPQIPRRPQTERKHLLTTVENQITDIRSHFQEEKQRHKQVNPNLIFQFEMTHKVNEKKFREELEKMDIKVLSASPSKDKYWVVFSSDENLEKFNKKLKDYSISNSQNPVFDAFSNLKEIPKEEKIGEKLRQNLIGDESEAIDIEIWRMDDDDLENFLKGFEKLVELHNGRITDTLKTRTFCLLRVKANKAVFDAILPLREVASIERLAQPYIDFSMLGIDIESLSVEEPLPNSTAIGIFDSGVRTQHPLLAKAVLDHFHPQETSPDLNTVNTSVEDDVGHGTKVASVALYGSMREKLGARVFTPDARILSAKVLKAKDDGRGKKSAVYDDEELLEHQIYNAVKQFREKYPLFRIANFSLGDTEQPLFDNRRQYNLAALLDEISKEFDLLCVVSTGNITSGKLDEVFPDRYPSYLLEEDRDVKIINPASSALSLTVGAIAQEFAPAQSRIPDDSDIWTSPVKTHYPSPFTRIGLGYNGMIKPELVEEGGNIITTHRNANRINIAGKILLANAEFASEGKLLTADFGTSFAAPTVTNYAARIFNKYPEYSPNLVKALLLLSAKIPKNRPDGLSDVNLNEKSDEKLVNLLKVYGYGKPNCESALNSSGSQVFFVHQDKIPLNRIHFYEISLPNEFVKANGDKRISVALSFNPEVNQNRADSYLGCSMEFRLFKNMTRKHLEKTISAPDADDKIEEEMDIPSTWKSKEIKCKPGVNLRSKGANQVGWVSFKRGDFIDTNYPLVLAVICRDRWMKKQDYKQEYGIVLSVEHKSEIDLYNRIKEVNKIRVRT